MKIVFFNEGFPKLLEKYKDNSKPYIYTMINQNLIKEIEKSAIPIPKECIDGKIYFNDFLKNNQNSIFYQESKNGDRSYYYYYKDDFLEENNYNQNWFVGTLSIQEVNTSKRWTIDHNDEGYGYIKYLEYERKYDDIPNYYITKKSVVLR